MSCHKVGAHQHQRRKRLRRKLMTLMSWGAWLRRQSERLAYRR